MKERANLAIVMVYFRWSEVQGEGVRLNRCSLLS
jgi:hypothetical protein